MYSKYKNGGNIIIKEIDSCLEELWEEKEQYWIDYYKKLGYDLMNIDKGGNGIITREKRSISSIERSIKGHEISIIALNLDGSFYKEFESSVKASKELGLKSNSSINNVLKGRAKSAGGYMWIYKKDYNPSAKYIYSKDKLGKSIFEFDTNGTLIKEWYNIAELDQIPGYSYNGVKNAIKSKKVYHNHYWSDNNSIDISKYQKYYNFKVINTKTSQEFYCKSQADICRLTGASAGNVCICIKENKLMYNLYKIEKL